MPQPKTMERALYKIVVMPAIISMSQPTWDIKQLRLEMQNLGASESEKAFGKSRAKRPTDFG